VRTSASWLQPALWCEKFQLLPQLSGIGAPRSWWPTIAEPSPLLVHALHVVSVCGVNAVPSLREPVRMSRSLGCRRGP